jgi:uncharacterized membrane protein (UPF0127 family)
VTAAARLEPLASHELDGGLRVFSAVRRGERRRGLAGLDGLPAAWGLRIARCRAVQTIGMRFALDLLWIGRDGSIVRVDRSIPPGRHAACLRARSVLEVGAGQADRFLAAWT